MTKNNHPLDIKITRFFFARENATLRNKDVMDAAVKIQDDMTLFRC